MKKILLSLAASLAGVGAFAQVYAPTYALGEPISPTELTPGVHEVIFHVITKNASGYLQSKAVPDDSENKVFFGSKNTSVNAATSFDRSFVYFINVAADGSFTIENSEFAFAPKSSTSSTTTYYYSGTTSVDNAAVFNPLHCITTESIKDDYYMLQMKDSNPHLEVHLDGNHNQWTYYSTGTGGQQDAGGVNGAGNTTRTACAFRMYKTTFGELVTNDKISELITDGAYISLQCKDWNGGFDYYFNGANSSKTSEFVLSNLFKIVGADDSATDEFEFKLQQVTTGKYVGKNNTDVTAVDAIADAAVFKAYVPSLDNFLAWTTKPKSYTVGVNTIRFESEGLFLNSQPHNSTPKFAEGKGGYSHWHVFAYTQEYVNSKIVQLRTDYENIIANGNAFVAMNLASTEGAAAWTSAVETVQTVDSNNFTVEAYSTILAAYRALVATSNNIAGDAHIKIASWKVPEDFMCVRFNPTDYHIYRNGSDVNGNKTTWTLKKAEGGFYLYNEYSAKYLQMASGDNQPATPVDAPADASIFVLDLYDAVAETPRYGIKHVGGVPNPDASKIYLHTNMTNDIFRWNPGNASSWYLSASDAETAQNEAKIGASDDVANALQYCGVEVGDAVGQYSASDEYANAIAAVNGLSDEASNESKRSAAAALRAAYATEGAFTLNMPRSGKFYRFRNVTSGKYMTGTVIDASKVNEVGGVGLIDDAEGNDLESVFYYDGSKLVAWQSGLCLGAFNGDGQWTMLLSTDSNVGNVSFAAASDLRGKYLILPAADCYLNGSGSALNRVDSADSGSTWTISEVAWLPVAIDADFGWTTLCAPVQLGFGYGNEVRVKAYTGTLNAEEAQLTVAELTEASIPANTGVLLQLCDAKYLDAETGHVYLPVQESTLPAVEGNELKGDIFAKEITAVAVAEAENVAPSYFAFTVKNADDADKYGVFNLTTEVPGFAAYIETANVAAESITIDDGSGNNPTGIEEITVDAYAGKTVIYDLQGRRLTEPVKGINIINGKKVLIR